MATRDLKREALLTVLNRTVTEAVAYFARVDENLSDGHQTARGVLAHLVFWHNEYNAILRDMLAERRLDLKVGTFATLNSVARLKYRYEPMSSLAHRLAVHQREFETLVRRLPGWSANFPIKHDSRFCCVEERITEIEAHIRNHVSRLRRAEQPLETAGR